jgi:hypothetical protein
LRLEIFNRKMTERTDFGWQARQHALGSIAEEVLKKNTLYCNRTTDFMGLGFATDLTLDVGAVNGRGGKAEHFRRAKEALGARRADAQDNFSGRQEAEKRPRRVQSEAEMCRSESAAIHVTRITTKA